MIDSPMARLLYLNMSGRPGGAAKGSAVQAVGGAGHWIQCRAAAATNAAMDAWLKGGEGVAQQDPPVLSSTSKPWSL